MVSDFIFYLRDNEAYTLFFMITYFIRISRLKFAKFYEYFKNKAETEILKRIDIILCAGTSVNTI